MNWLRSRSPAESTANDSELPATGTKSRLKKILVATDFSECSRKALDYATSLGRQFNAELIILHVIEAMPPQFRIVEAMLMENSLHDEAVHQLQEWSAHLGPEVKVTTVLREGSPASKEIVEVAKQLEADLVVIGNHGRKALERRLMGNTAERVVRFAPCPVLVIKETERDFVSRCE